MAGGSPQSDRRILTDVDGVSTSQSVFQHDRPKPMARAVGVVVHDCVASDKAIELVGRLDKQYHFKSFRYRLSKQRCAIHLYERQFRGSTCFLWNGKYIKKATPMAASYDRVPLSCGAIKAMCSATLLDHRLC